MIPALSFVIPAILCTQILTARREKANIFPLKASEMSTLYLISTFCVYLFVPGVDDLRGQVYLGFFRSESDVLSWVFTLAMFIAFVISVVSFFSTLKALQMYSLQTQNKEIPK